MIIGQLLRVGKAVTPPEGIVVSQQLAANQLPTASALAAASITAQLQAQDSLDTISAGTLSALNAQNVFSQVASNPLTGYGFNSPGIASTASSVMGIPMPNSYTSSVAPTPITTTT